MALIVEDGTIVENANSYNSLSELRAYALARGVALSATDGVVEVMAIKAMDYLNTLTYCGYQVDAETQSLPFPRKEIYIDYAELPTDTIPLKLKQAQAQLVIEVFNGVDLLPTTAGGTKFVTKQKVGPIEREFSEAAYLAGGNTPIMRFVTALLVGLVCGGGFALRTVRV